MYGRIIYNAVLHDSLLLPDSVSDSKTDYMLDQINKSFIYWALKCNSPFLVTLKLTHSSEVWNVEFPACGSVLR